MLVPTKAEALGIAASITMGPGLAAGITYADISQNKDVPAPITHETGAIRVVEKFAVNLSILSLGGLLLYAPGAIAVAHYNDRKRAINSTAQDTSI